MQAESSKSIVIDLPLPPSLNRIWRRGLNKQTRKGFTYLDPSYVRWKTAADGELLRQRVGKGWSTIPGKFVARLVVNRKKLRANADIDNRFKGVGDWAQKAGLIENDKNLVKLTLEFGDAPLGVRLYLEPVEAQDLVA